MREADQNRTAADFLEPVAHQLRRRRLVVRDLEKGFRGALELIDGYIGEGYAIPYPRAVETIKLLARTQGILLDPTYTAKGMTGFVETIRRGGVRNGATPLFVHTGGAFGLMARRDLFESEI